MQRGVPTTSAQQNPNVRLIGSLDSQSEAGITVARLWTVMRRFFQQAADVLASRNPVVAEKLRRASPALYLKKPLDISNRISYRGGWIHRTRSSGP